MAAKRETNAYSISLFELERNVHVPVDEQVSEQSEPPPPGPFSPEDVDRNRLLGVTGAGRLRLP